jgi:quercetin dioxygenase-like cupin family protein
MKKSIQIISGIFLIGIFLMQCAVVQAQDPIKAAPNVYKKVIVDNEKVRVMEVEFAPGETAAWHQHPDHVACAVTDGKLEITEKGKEPVVADLKAGDAMYMPAVTHMAKNIGTTTLRLVVTEIKSESMKGMESTTMDPK